MYRMHQGEEAEAEEVRTVVVEEVKDVAMLKEHSATVGAEASTATETQTEDEMRQYLLLNWGIWSTEAVELLLL